MQAVQGREGSGDESSQAVVSARDKAESVQNDQTSCKGCIVEDISSCRSEDLLADKVRREVRLLVLLENIASIVHVVDLN